jgi:hypothetical protein
VAPVVYSGVAGIIVVASIVGGEWEKTRIGLGVLAAGGVAYGVWKRVAKAA